MMAVESVYMRESYTARQLASYVVRSLVVDLEVRLLDHEDT